MRLNIFFFLAIILLASVVSSKPSYAILPWAGDAFLEKLIAIGEHNNLQDLDFTNKTLGLVPLIGSDGKQAFSGSNKPDGCAAAGFLGCGNGLELPGIGFNTIIWSYASPENSIFVDHPSGFSRLKFTYTLHNDYKILSRRGFQIASSLSGQAPKIEAELRFDNIDEYKCITQSEIYAELGNFPRFSADDNGSNPSVFQIAFSDQSITDITVFPLSGAQPNSCISNITVTQHISNPRPPPDPMNPAVQMMNRLRNQPPK